MKPAPKRSDPGTTRRLAVTQIGAIMAALILWSALETIISFASSVLTAGTARLAVSDWWSARRLPSIRMFSAGVSWPVIFVCVAGSVLLAICGLLIALWVYRRDSKLAAAGQP